MANWVIRCSERYLSLVYDKLREHLCRQSVIQADETTCQVTKDGREGVNKSYMEATCLDFLEDLLPWSENLPEECRKKI